jgi:hypothetical protein
MMTAPFDPTKGPIQIEAEVSGPTGRSSLQLLIDTAATTSVVDPTILTAVGYDPGAATTKVKVAMGGGVVSVPLLFVNRLTVLGQHRIGFSVLSHALPPEPGVDGLLGLDFLRGQILTLDFRDGLIALS